MKKIVYDINIIKEIAIKTRMKLGDILYDLETSCKLPRKFQNWTLSDFNYHFKLYDYVLQHKFKDAQKIIQKMDTFIWDYIPNSIFNFIERDMN